jgi:hypothetical protein
MIWVVNPDPDPEFLPIPDPGFRGHGTGSRIRIGNTGFSGILYLEGADSVVLLLEKKGHSIVSLLYSAQVLSREPDRPFADPESPQVSFRVILFW